MAYRPEERAEDLTPKQWYRDVTQYWSYQAKEIARAVRQTPQGQTVDLEEKNRWGKALGEEEMQAVFNFVKELDSLPPRVMDKIVASFQVFPCSVNRGRLKFEKHPKVARSRRFS